MLPVPQIPPAPPQLLAIAPAHCHDIVQEYVLSYANSQFVPTFDLVFMPTVQEALKNKALQPASGILYQELLGPQDIAYLAAHFYTTFAVVSQATPFASASRTFELLFYSSMQFLKQRVAAYAKIQQFGLLQTYKLLCYYAQLVIMLKPPTIDKSVRDIAQKSKISFLAASVIVITQLEFAGNSQFKPLFDCKNDFVEYLETFLQDLQRDMKRGLTISNLALYTSAFKLKCELMLVLYQKRLYGMFNESEVTVVNGASVEIQQSYLHVRNAKSEVQSPLKGSRHYRTKSEFIEQTDNGGYLVLVNETLQLLQLNLDNFQLVKIAEEYRTSYLSVGDEGRFKYQLQAANLLLNSRSYQFIFYLFLMNLSAVIVYMTLLPLVMLLNSAEAYLHDGLSPDVQWVYKKILESGEDPPSGEAFISCRFLFSALSSLAPPGMRLGDIDCLNAQLYGLGSASGVTADDSHQQLFRLAKIAYLLRSMLVREIFGDLFLLVRPVGLAIRVFDQLSRIDIMGNVQASTSIALAEFTAEPPAVPDFSDFENLVLTEKVGLDFCERFCKSQGYSLNYLLANTLLCRLLRVLQHQAQHNGQPRLCNKLSYYLSKCYEIRGETEAAKNEQRAALLNGTSILALHQKLERVFGDEQTQLVAFFAGCVSYYISFSGSLTIPGQIAGRLSLKFERIAYVFGDRVRLSVLFEAPVLFDRVLLQGTYQAGGESRNLNFEISQNKQTLAEVESALIYASGVLIVNYVELHLISKEASAVARYDFLVARAQIRELQSYVSVECSVQFLYIGETRTFDVYVRSELDFVLYPCEDLDLYYLSQNSFRINYTANSAAPLVLNFQAASARIAKKIDVLLPAQYSMRFLPQKYVQIDGIKYFYDLWLQVTFEFCADGLFTIVPEQIAGFSHQANIIKTQERSFRFVERLQREANAESFSENVRFAAVRYDFYGRAGQFYVERHLFGFGKPAVSIIGNFGENYRCNVPFLVEIVVETFGRVFLQFTSTFIVLGCSQVNLAVYGRQTFKMRLICENPGRWQILYKGRFYTKSLEGCLGDVLVQE